MSRFSSRVIFAFHLKTGERSFSISDFLLRQYKLFLIDIFAIGKLFNLQTNGENVQLHHTEAFGELRKITIEQFEDRRASKRSNQ